MPLACARLTTALTHKSREITNRRDSFVRMRLPTKLRADEVRALKDRVNMRFVPLNLVAFIKTQRRVALLQDAPATYLPRRIAERVLVMVFDDEHTIGREQGCGV